MVNMLPVSRLQMPHLVAAKASPDESAGFVAIELESLPTTRSEAQSDWLDLAASFPNLRTRFLRSGRQMYQQVVEVGDCSERVFVSDGGEFRFEDDSFDVPCFYVWDPVTNSASLRVHHALVDSFSVAVIRSRGARFDVSQYEDFLRRTHSASVAEYATKIEPCMVPVEDEGFRDSYRVSRAHLPNQGSDALALDGEFNFWFACFCDTLARLELDSGEHVLVPMSFRDLIGPCSQVPGLATGSVGVDALPSGSTTGDARRGLLRSVRERSDRIAVGSWRVEGMVPIEFAYDDSPTRLLRFRRLAGSAGFEVIKQHRGEYLLVCSAGVGSRFTRLSVDDLICVFVQCANRRGVALHRS